MPRALMPRAPRRALRAGYTLLEVMLALSLAVVVIAALAMAIDLHLRLIDKGRTEVEQAQLARAVLRQIADDLRGAVRYEPMDFESLVPLPSGLPTISAEDADPFATLPDGTASGDPADLAAQAAEAASGEGEEEEQVEVSQAPQSTPGLYGNQYELQVDVSRLPRLDQYAAFAAAETAAQAAAAQVSDVKTISWYVQRTAGPQSGATGAALDPSSILGAADGGGGLVRRELDRAAAVWANQRGELAGWDREQSPLAPEVTAVEFRYFDGAQWTTNWDAELQEGLPMAVEIAVAIASPAQQAGLVTQQELATAAEAGQRIYRLLVHLPAARPYDPAAEAAAEESKESEDEAADDDAADAGEDAAGAGGGAGSPPGAPRGQGGAP